MRMAATSFPTRRYAAELGGTFLLTTAIASSGPMPVPLTAGLTLALLAYLLGPISGAHVNPAVTLGLFTRGLLTFRDALGYVIAQLLGGFIASLLLAQMIEIGSLPVGHGGAGSIAEILGSFILVYGVARVVRGRVGADISGLVVGLSLFTGIIVASAGSLAILNPAVALGLGAFDPASSALAVNVVIYLLAPLVGGFLGAQASDWMTTGNN